MFIRAVVGAILLLLSNGARAQLQPECDRPELAEKLARLLHPGQSANTRLSACRTWPLDPKLTILALALYDGTPPAADEHWDGEYDMHLVLVEVATAEVVASLMQRKAWSTDAVRLERVSIDTGRYRLATSTRAFGVRTHSVAQSRANPYDDEVLSLFVVDGSRIVPILERLEMRRYSGEWDTNCAGDFETRTSTISVSPNPRRQYADLILRRRTEKSTAKVDESGECQESGPTTSEDTVIPFVDGKYAIPEGLRALQ